MSAILVLLAAFILLLIINVPVAFCMALACILALFWQGTVPIRRVTLKLYSGIDTFPFLAIPLFILAGGLMERGESPSASSALPGTWSAISRGASDL